MGDDFIQAWTGNLTIICLVLAIPVSFGFLAAAIGSRKGAAGPSFLLGLFLGPIGCILALLTDSRPKCPRCLERVERGATICWRCHTGLAWRGGKSPVVRY